MPVTERLARFVLQRVLALAARGVVTLVDDSAKLQKLQVRVLEGELRSGIQHVQPYGFNSVPLEGAYPAVLLCPFGDRAQMVAVLADDVRHRPTGGAPGDSELYDSRGNRVRLRDGVLEITAAADLTVAVAGDGTVAVEGAGNLTIEGAATLTLQAGVTVNVTGNATVSVSGNATLTTAGQLNLGGPGGPAVARVGDPVVGGVITAGSAKVHAV